MAQVVYTNVTGDVDGGGALFEGMKIWLAQRVPQRQRFVQQVQVSIEITLRKRLLAKPFDGKGQRWRGGAAGEECTYQIGRSYEKGSSSWHVSSGDDSSPDRTTSLQTKT